MIDSLPAEEGRAIRRVWDCSPTPQIRPPPLAPTDQDIRILAVRINLASLWRGLIFGQWPRETVDDAAAQCTIIRHEFLSSCVQNCVPYSCVKPGCILFVGLWEIASHEFTVVHHEKAMIRDWFDFEMAPHAGCIGDAFVCSLPAPRDAYPIQPRTYAKCLGLAHTI